MNKETAEKMLKNWEKHEQESDFPNKFINDLLEASQLIEREQSLKDIESDRWDTLYYAFGKEPTEVLNCVCNACWENFWALGRGLQSTKE